MSIEFAAARGSRSRPAPVREDPTLVADVPALLLGRLRTLAHLTEEELAEIGRLAWRQREVARYRQLVFEGQSPQHLHVLIEGWAARSKVVRDGRCYLSAVLVPGDICDIDGLHVRLYDYSVTALTRCTVATVDRPALLALCDAHPRIAHVLGWLGFVDNAMLTENATSLAVRSARQRAAHLLCELKTRLGMVGLATAEGFDLPLTQEKLGDALGLTAVHVNRVLRELRLEGMIDVAGGRATVRNWAGLQHVAGFAPDYLHLEGMRRAGV